MRQVLRQLRAEDVALGPAPAGAADSDPILPLQEHERRYLSRVLAHTCGVIYGPGGAAQLLGLPPATLYSRIRTLGIIRP